MDILGIGIPELAFIMMIALIILGPKDMQKAGRTVGTWLRKVVTSNEWQNVKSASRNIKSLPSQLMREAGFEEGEIKELGRFEPYRNEKIKVTMPAEDYGAWGGRPKSPPATENSIAPPADTEPATAKETDAQSLTNTANPEDLDHA